MSKHLIDIAYEIATKKIKTKKFSFRELFKLVIQSHPEFKNDAGDLYVDLINDIRFLSIGKDEWTLSKNLKFNEINKISSLMFGLDKYSLDDDHLDEDLKELLMEHENTKERIDDDAPTIEKDDYSSDDIDMSDSMHEIEINESEEIDEDDEDVDDDSIEFDEDIDIDDEDLDDSIIDDDDMEEEIDEDYDE